MDRFAHMALLYDTYGALLSPRQREVTALYYGENLSLAEIGEEFGISRQGVHDALRSAQHALEEYEEKLGLLKKAAGRDKAAEDIRVLLKELKEETAGETTSPAVQKKTEAVLQALEELEGI